MITKSDKYAECFNEDYLMGPNSIRLLDELLTLYPIDRNDKNKILDLGCGKGLTSLFIAKETGATVYANDLWISAEENASRFEEWHMQHKMIPTCEDASNLSFEKCFFDSIISIDAYHYFAGRPGFFENNILPFVKPGGMVLIAVPGIKEEFEESAKEVLGEWTGEEYYMFHSPRWWKDIIGLNDSMEYVKTWEMTHFNMAWGEWLATDHMYAKRDKIFFKDVIERYTNFVGIVVRKK